MTSAKYSGVISLYYIANTQKESLMRTGSCVWCQLLHADCRYLLLCLHATVNIFLSCSLDFPLSLLFHTLSFFFLNPPQSIYLFTLFFHLPFILLTSVVWSAFFFFPSISAIIAFHPAEYGDGNNLTLLLRGDTILLWLIEVPSESQRRCRSSLSHSLTGNPLYCFIDCRQ